MANKKLKVAFLGGVGEIGKNMTVLECGNDIIVIDAGLAFPSQDMPGIDLVIPDFSYLLDKADKIRAILTTHGHEDHIGALPFILKDVKAPVYGTKLTLALIEHKLREHRIDDAKLVPVSYDSKIKLGCFTVEFIKVCHSISGAASLAIETPSGLVFHTGDFKIDFTPIDGEPMDLGKLAQIGNKGVTLMLGESTNVEREGYSMSERTVGATFDRIFGANLTRRIIIATFASNVHRLQQIIDLAERYGRKVAFSGRSMENVTEMALSIGELRRTQPFVKIEKAKDVPDDKLVIICTGSQGEPMSALTRMANGNSKVKIGSNDTIVISSTPIPGNEKHVFNVVNNLYRLGANVVYEALEDVHVSGHACKEEIKTMHALIKPRYFIPVHGEYRHLKQHSMLAESMGIPESNIIIPELGDYVEVTRGGIKKVSQIKAGQLLVDGATVGDMSSVVLLDRQHLAEDGLLIVVVGLSLKNGKIYSGPEFISRGFSLGEEETEEVKRIVTSVVKNFDLIKNFDRDEVTAALKKAMKKYILKHLRQTPMILPVVMEH